mmetsp:Transcript_67645/g.214140  ORF Transcript_67645/g.214140 Transcript_67645/m.214140 type:complete len:225 (+) Transcript_67645:86-760(+)|eukprot:CAMPEP_0182880324 /NCGR_PEP_ID=MMETSP0034_2-20130328/16503_1 /TAXON_ID=156128 /ORGANISM="Nephroselmis pyriformis, Strain CCMP717" /LENGTH=224 /DNA_ID=CAMNT_0025013305 /DNA_START=49 /DNA_END=723 /DNA_ORIENTATION=+
MPGFPQHDEGPGSEAGSRSLSREDYEAWKAERDAAALQRREVASEERRAAIEAGTAQMTGREMFDYCPEVFDVDEAGRHSSAQGSPARARPQEVVTGVAGLEATLAGLECLSPGVRVGVMFTANEDPATGQSWCGDCRRAEPEVRAAFHGAILVMCLVGDRHTWRDAGHPLRRHEQLQLRGVPVLAEWSAAGGWGRQFDLESCADAASVAAMARDFLSDLLLDS